MEFVKLLEHPQYIDLVADWMYTAFCEQDRPSLTRFDIKKRLETSCSDTLPMVFIAIIEGECVGTFSLYQNDLAGESVTPWLASLFVRPDLRGKGVGRFLIDSVSRVAKEMGFETLYLRTEHTAAYYDKLGWTLVKQTVDPVYQLNTSMYSIALSQ